MLIDWEAISAVSFIILTGAIIYSNWRQHVRLVRLEQLNLKIQTFNKYFEIYSIYKKVDILLHNFDFYINYLIEAPEKVHKKYLELDECQQKIIDTFAQIDILFDEKTCDILQKFPMIIIHHLGLYAGTASYVEGLISNKKEDEYQKLLKSRHVLQLRQIYSVLKKTDPSAIDLTYDGDLPKCRKEYDAIHNTGVIDILKSKCELYK